VQSRGQHYALGVGSVAKEITFNCGDYCTQYLISGGIECSYSWISWVLRRCPLMSLLERWTGVMLKTSLSLRHLSGHIFYINDFFHCGLMHPSKLSAHATEWGPAKLLPIGPGNRAPLGLPACHSASAQSPSAPFWNPKRSGRTTGKCSLWDGG